MGINHGGGVGHTHTYTDTRCVEQSKSRSKVEQNLGNTDWRGERSGADFRKWVENRAKERKIRVLMKREGNKVARQWKKRSRKRRRKRNGNRNRNSNHGRVSHLLSFA